MSLNSIIDVLKKFTTATELRRYNESTGTFEGVFEINLDNHLSMDNLKSELLALGNYINVVFIDNKYVAV